MSRRRDRSSRRRRRGGDGEGSESEGQRVDASLRGAGDGAGSQLGLNERKLFYHVKNGNRPRVKHYVQNEGISTTIVDKDGWTLLHHAANAGDPVVAQYLLEHGVSKNDQIDASNIRDKTFAGWTALHVACFKGDEAMCQLLISYGLDISIANDRGRGAKQLLSRGGASRRIKKLFDQQSQLVSEVRARRRERRERERASKEEEDLDSEVDAYFARRLGGGGGGGGGGAQASPAPAPAPEAEGDVELSADDVAAADDELAALAAIAIPGVAPLGPVPDNDPDPSSASASASDDPFAALADIPSGMPSSTSPPRSPLQPAPGPLDDVAHLFDGSGGGGGGGGGGGSSGGGSSGASNEKDQRTIKNLQLLVQKYKRQNDALMTQLADAEAEALSSSSAAAPPGSIVLTADSDNPLHAQFFELMKGDGVLTKLMQTMEKKSYTSATEERCRGVLEKIQAKGQVIVGNIGQEFEKRVQECLFLINDKRTQHTRAASQNGGSSSGHGGLGPSVPSLPSGPLPGAAPDVPPMYLCPLSGQVMTDPVTLLATGMNFERSAIETYLRTNSNDPLSGRPLRSKDLAGNLALRIVIEEWRSNHQ